VVDLVLREPAARVRPPAEPVPRFLLGTRAGAVFGALARMNDGDRHAAQRKRVEALLQASIARKRQPMSCGSPTSWLVPGGATATSARSTT
jgi:hypothetical protein